MGDYSTNDLGTTPNEVGALNHTLLHSKWVMYIKKNLKTIAVVEQNTWNGAGLRMPQNPSHKT